MGFVTAMALKQAREEYHGEDSEFGAAVGGCGDDGGWHRAEADVDRREVALPLGAESRLHGWIAGVGGQRLVVEPEDCHSPFLADRGDRTRRGGGVHRGDLGR